jgi:hypothetical protein
MEYDTPPGRSYRYYTGQPLFPFGSGLSLTTFTHSCTCAKLTLQQDDSDISCSCTVHNTGTVAGDEVLMVYDSLSAGIRSKIGKAHPVPLKRLVEFERVTVAAGKSAPVPFKIPKKALSITTADGSKMLYSGSHALVFSRGNGADVTIEVTV